MTPEPKQKNFAKIEHVFELLETENRKLTPGERQVIAGQRIIMDFCTKRSAPFWRLSRMRPLPRQFSMPRIQSWLFPEKSPQVVRDARGPWESFSVVQLGNDRIALRASNGQYVSATGPNGTLLANRDCIGPTETFLMVHVHKSRIALKASNGKFVCAEDGGGRALIANRDVAGEWESFYILPL